MDKEEEWVETRSMVFLLSVTFMSQILGLCTVLKFTQRHAHTQTSDIERVQKRAIKLSDGVEEMSYSKDLETPS